MVSPVGTLSKLMSDLCDVSLPLDEVMRRHSSGGSGGVEASSPSSLEGRKNQKGSENEVVLKIEKEGGVVERKLEVSFEVMEEKVGHVDRDRQEQGEDVKKGVKVVSKGLVGKDPMNVQKKLHLLEHGLDLKQSERGPSKLINESKAEAASSAVKVVKKKPSKGVKGIRSRNTIIGFFEE
jgi:hypothetical protein